VFDSWRDSWRRGLGLGASGAEPDLSSLRALLEESAQVLRELETEETRLAVREAELAKAGDGSLPELATVRGELAAHRERLLAMRTAREHALALARDLEARPAGADRAGLDLAGTASAAWKLAGEAARTAREVMLFCGAETHHGAALSAGQNEKAIALCDARLRVNPSDARARLHRGVALSRLGHVREALVEYDHALRLRPGYDLALVDRADAKLTLGDALGAKADADEALRLSPRLVLGFVNRGRARRALLDEEGALEDFGQALRLDARHVLARVERASIALERGLLDLALADAELALGLERKDPERFALRAEVRWARGELDLALADASEAIRLEPSRASRYLLRARIHRARDDARAAGADREEACRAERDEALALLHRAEAKREALEWDAALSLANDALRLRPDLWSAFHARSLAHEGRRETREALDDLERVLARFPGTAWVLALRARLLLWHDPARALADAGEALGKGFLPALALRAEALLALSDLAGARVALDALVRARPRDDAAWAQRGRLRLLAGDLEGGRADLGEAARLAPASAGPRLWLAAFGGDPTLLEPLASSERWDAHLARLLLGRHGEETIVEEARQAPSEHERLDRASDAHGFLGLLAERAGDEARALVHYEACVAAGTAGRPVCAWAVARLVAHRARSPLPDAERLEKLCELGVLTREETDEARRKLGA
jgi:tetratricopeptide (TPR) repeat protein